MPQSVQTASPTYPVAQQDYAIEDFQIDKLPRGRKQTGTLAIAPRVDGSQWQLPYLALTGTQHGPTLVVFAGVHGDEYEGMEAIPRVFHALTPDQVRGQLIMVPVCNVPAYEAGTRSSPVDSLNLARVYPGDPTGTITQRIAYWTGQRLISQSDFFIDLHSGNATSDIPTLIGYIHDAGELGQRGLAGARAFGAPVLWGHPLPLPPGRTISLATQLGIPALYTETPGGGRARPSDVDCYAQGVHNVMCHLGMLAGAPKPRPTTHHLVGDGNLDAIITTPAAGRFMPYVDLLDAVDAGQIVGEIHDAYGNVVMPLHADRAGVIILLRRERRVHVGDGVIQITGIVP
ncbi:MAG: M14 family metallopeptidase [Litorilinea sp.]